MPFRKVVDDDPGQWFVYGKDGDKDVRFRVRPLPLWKNAEIQRTFEGMTRQVKVDRQGTAETTRNLEKEVGAVLARASYSLIDSENCRVEVPSEKAAQAYRELLKDSSIQAGDVVALDGRWTDELRKDFLTDTASVGVPAWIVERAAEQGSVKVKEEEGKG